MSIKKNIISIIRQKKGVALLLSVVIVAGALSIAMSIADIFYTQIRINREARESYAALYAADAGKECALYYLKRVGSPIRNGYWDPNRPCAGSVSGGACSTNITCAGLSSVVTYTPSGSVHRFQFAINKPPVGIEPGICANVSVDSSQDPVTLVVQTIIRAEGRSSCTATRPVSRVLEVCERPSGFCSP